MTPWRTRRPSPASVALGVVVVVAAVLVVLPDLFRLDRYIPFAQLVALRPYLLVLTAVAAVLVALRRRWWPPAAGLGLVVLVGAALVVPRAVGSEPAGAAPRVLTVLALNVQEGSASVQRIAGLIRRYDPDLIALPEAGAEYADRLSRAVAGTGYRFRSSPDATATQIDAITVGIAPRLGRTRIVIGDRGVFPSIEVTGGALGRLRFVAFHAAAPVPGRMAGWRGDLWLLPQWCASERPAIVAGDFNATLDHSVLRRAMTGCRDSAAELGRGLVATWPARWPRWLGAQIDHVLITEELQAVSFAVFDVAGTDHRAVLARVAVSSG